MKSRIRVTLHVSAWMMLCVAAVMPAQAQELPAAVLNDTAAPDRPMGGQ